MKIISTFSDGCHRTVSCLYKCSAEAAGAALAKCYSILSINEQYSSVSVSVAVDDLLDRKVARYVIVHGLVGAQHPSVLRLSSPINYIVVPGQLLVRTSHKVHLVRHVSSHAHPAETWPDADLSHNST